MKKNERKSLQLSIINVRKTLNTQDSEKSKKRKSIKTNYKKKDTDKKDREDKLLSNAYKNVLNVLTNLLDNIEDEKMNGKTNMLGTHRRNQSLIKNYLMKRVSYDRPNIRFRINKYNSSKTDSSLDNLNKNKTKKNYNLKSLNKNFDKSSNLTGDEKNCLSDLGDFKRHKIKRILKKKLNENLFFKPKNKLRSNSNKYSIKPLFDKKNEKEIIINKTSLISENNFNNKCSSALSSFSPLNNNLFKITSLSKKYNSASKDDSTSKLNSSNFFNSNPNLSSSLLDKQRKNEYNEELLSPYNKTDKKVKIIPDVSNEKNILNLKEEKTNDPSSGNSRSVNEQVLEKKKKKIRKSNSAEMIDRNTLKSIKGNFTKTFCKENNYRCLLSKGYVYDSLDDEEEYEDEEEANFYFEPNSIFLYILDSITFISSFIILFYLPIYMSKKLYFCRDVHNRNTIMFYSIDIIYIFDLIINFYRSYYNFDEVLIKKSILICIHYIKTWFFFDLISSIPIYSIINLLESKCINKTIYYDFKLNNNGNHSQHYNVNMNKLHYILLLLKVIKTIKIFKKNIAVKKLRYIFKQTDFFNHHVDVFSYTLYFFSFLNLASCIYIFIGRNIIGSWIFLDNLETKSFWDIYISSVYYFVMTVTTVGYGDVIGRSKLEILFQVIMIIAGTCIYSWLISSVSNYVKKINEKNIKYEEKIQILEEIKLNNSNFSEKLYKKITRLLIYRKYHEEEIEKSIILESLPNSLKHTLIIDMYKDYITGFSFFRGIENREFIVGIISKLTPIIGIKGDILIQEGEYIEEIIFIKNGVLSLEVWIDTISPEKSIENYFYENGFIDNKNHGLKDISFFNSVIKTRKNSIISRLSHSVVNNYLEKLENKNESAFNENKKKIKILDIRRNEHFGDVFMFLNKKSPLYVKVRSKKADLLLLRKLDAISISNKFPDIWKTIIKRPLDNSKIISNLTIKMLSIYCNLNGIKTNLFKKKNKNTYPKYYLKPLINKPSSIKPKKTNTIKLLISDRRNKSQNETSPKDYIEENEINNLKKLSLDEISKNEIKEFDYNNNIYNNNNHTVKNNYFQNTSFSFNNNTKIKNNDDISFKNSDKSIDKYLKENTKNKASSKFLQKPSVVKQTQSLFDPSEIKNNEEEMSFIKKENVSGFSDNTKKGNNIQNKNTDLSNSFSINKRKISYNLSNNRENLENINDEIYPGENFNIPLYEFERPNIINTNINNIKNIITDNKYINQFNIIGINYLGFPLNNKDGNQKSEKTHFNNLKISTVSKLKINSSYENINYITSNEYIKNDELKEETKRFLLDKCRILESKTNKSFQMLNTPKNLNLFNKKRNFASVSNIQSIKNSSRLSLKLPKNTFDDNLNRCKTRKIKRSSVQNYEINNITKNNISNDVISAFQNSIYLKSERSNNKIKKTNSSSSYTEKPIREIHSFLMDNKRMDDTFYENDFRRKSFNGEFLGGITPKIRNFSKKKKKKSELDIISSNIQKSSQNLNQPDIFYAGLFNQLIGNYKNKSACRISNISHNYEVINEKNNKDQSNIKSFRLHTSDNISN